MKLSWITKGLSVVGKAIKIGAAKVAKAIVAADTASLIKFGIVFGVTVTTSFLIIKFLKDKKKSYHDESNMSVVDEAININYNDVDNQEKLHPLMKKVKKNLKKDLKPRKKVDKKVSRAKKAFQKAAEESEQRRKKLSEEEFDEYVEETNRRLDQFLKDMAFEDEYQNEINKLFGQDDEYNLRAVWEYN